MPHGASSGGKSLTSALMLNLSFGTAVNDKHKMLFEYTNNDRKNQLKTEAENDSNKDRKFLMKQAEE